MHLCHGYCHAVQLLIPADTLAYPPTPPCANCRSWLEYNMACISSLDGPDSEREWHFYTLAWICTSAPVTYGFGALHLCSSVLKTSERVQAYIFVCQQVHVAVYCFVTGSVYLLELSKVSADYGSLAMHSIHTPITPLLLCYLPVHQMCRFFIHT